MTLKFNLFNRSILTLMAACLMLLVGCKRDFDTPDPIVDPNLTPTHTLAALKARITASNQGIIIPDDVVLAGVVVADDRSGNLYKTIYIQDATGGLTLSLDRAQLYGDYPVGRKIYVKAKGLYLYDYNNMITIGIQDLTNPGSPSTAGIPSQLLDNYIIKGSLNNPVTASPVTVSQLTTNMQDKYLGTLIELDGYEFDLGDTKIPYADTTLSKSAGERYIKPCTNASANRVMVRTSAYSNFAALHPAAGNGKIWAIYTAYRTTKQLVIRDTSDVKFTNARCGSNVAIPKNLKELRALKDGATIPEGTTLNVIAISNNLNEPSGNIIIQDATAGITMRLFDIDYKFPTELTIDFSGATLGTFNGTLQVTLGGGTGANGRALVKTVGTKAVTPPVKTVLQTLNEYDALMGTLVKINDVTITKGTENATGTNYTVKDATGEILTFVRVATGITVPVGKATSITGYVSQFSGVGQLVIRAESDIVGGGQPGGDPGSGSEAKKLTEDFETGSKNGYAAGDVELASGSWNLSDGGIFTGSSASTSDLKTGSNSVRLRGTSTLESFAKTNFHVTGLKKINFKFGGATFNEGTDQDNEISVEVKISKDGGSTWTSLGKQTGKRGEFTNASVNVTSAATDKILVRIENTSFMRSTNNRLRINIDDVVFEK
ncbi:DUF5689 domain-containing protein [Polluticaenibacter yanchengensis]|uniref:DUF5689 domain-containing protein n=1 Tax=Polluticaenibacter yanchengensis TaxID=3014562 RepID=A0ABT4UIY0_9BACT|nr:DUF5689 domain-containing protein [Chitinophagaceae bacterium LY-5]